LRTGACPSAFYILYKEKNVKKATQRESNPFLYSDSNKRYHTYDYYLRHTFGEKVAKITLDGGFTCPNRDGTCGTGGCIYCSGRGSGDFTESSLLPVQEQFRRQAERIRRKWDARKFIAYFQAFTNTYAPLPRLKALYEEALACEGVVGLNIGTRADCLPDEVIAYLDELSARTVVTVELGLQTVHDDTARRINRGHDYATFLDAYTRLRQKAPRVRIGVHLIFGLVGENDEKLIKTVQSVAELVPDEVKIHLLYVLENTEMAQIYRNGAYFPMTKEEYVNWVVRALEMLPPQVVVARLTGDADAKSLVAPLWSVKKGNILNEIDKNFYANNTCQGKSFCNSGAQNS
jgi:radical SAM protein (TIGR01212 family)